MTSEQPSTGGSPSDARALTSSAGDFPANPSPSQDSSEESRTSVGDGHGCETSSALFSLESFSPRTWRRCLGTLKHFESSSATFPTSGSMSSGMLYQRAPWVPHTHDDGCSLWPTPVARDFKGYTHRNRESICNVLREMYGGTGRPNPRWIEWLMGFPVGWCEMTSTDSGMPSSPPSPSESDE